MNYLPKHATVPEACEWLATETGEPWTLARLLEHSLMPWVWIDYEPRFPEIFGDRLEGFTRRCCSMATWRAWRLGATA